MTIEGSSANHVKQQNIETALRNSEENFRLLVSAVQDYAIFMLDLEGCISTWNEGAERIKGYTADEVMGRHFSLFYIDEDRVAGLPENELAIARARGHCEVEGWRLRRDGSRFLANVVLTPLRDDNGALRGFGQVTRDLSSRRQLEERFRRVVESAPSAMVMINALGTIEMVNEQTEKLFGYQRAQLLGQPIEILVPERFRPQHPRLRGGFFADPHARPMGAGRDLFAMRKDGSEFAVEIGLNPIETEEGPMVLSAIVDISDRKQKEMRIQAALREKDVLLGEIHHRVKNNLQIIDSLLDLQSSRIEDESIRSVLRDSQNRIRSMALIHQTLYQSKDFARVDLAGVLESLIPNLVASYGLIPERIELQLDVEEVFLSINQAIPCGLIVNELITNALKHAFPESKGQIEVELALDKDTVALTIGDNGAGVPAHVEWGKTGTLGLQLVQLLAEQLGGSITMQRSPTRFELRFPLAV
jgi:PAS domain S-box-containing protein